MTAWILATMFASLFGVQTVRLARRAVPRPREWILNDIEMPDPDTIDWKPSYGAEKLEGAGLSLRVRLGDAYIEGPGILFVGNRDSREMKYVTAALARYANQKMLEGVTR